MMLSDSKAAIMDLQPILQNDLVLLRPLQPSDFDALYAIASDPLIWTQHPNNDRHQQDVFRTFFSDAIASGGALVVIDKVTDRIIGSSRFKRVLRDRTAVEIGWTFLSRDYWGGVYNRAVKHLMLDHAFRTMERVIFHIGNTNIRSQRAVEKIGGVRITESEYPLLIKGGDNCTYLIRRTDWKH